MKTTHRLPLSQERIISLTEEESLLAGTAVSIILASELPPEVRRAYHALAARLELTINRRFARTGSDGWLVNFQRC